MRETLRSAAEMDVSVPPPGLAERIHARVRELSGAHDPYRSVKTFFINALKAQREALRKRIEAAENPLEAAVRIAGAGNIVDFGVRDDLTVQEVGEALKTALDTPFDADMTAFAAAVSKAENILYIADNAGEAVLDTLLIEQLAPARVTVVVRDAPVINDVTREDAEAAGLPEVAEVISSGSGAPGLMLEKVSADFRTRFEAADLVIAKGQGNFEGLSDVNREVFFLFMVKCSVVAADTGRPKGNLVLLRRN